MTPDPTLLPQLAEARLDENYDFRQFLKNHPELSSEQIDKIVFELDAKIWKKIDCTTCANCCRHVSPTLSEEDVTRLAGHLGLSNAEFTASYLAPTESSSELPWVMRDKPCPFLKDNLCSVYEHRPANCRDYPYLNKPDLVFRTLNMIGRTAECPAVFEVWEELKRATGFRHGRR
jgi:Predicted Fe-S-cluster oxidoreductase